MHELPLLTNLAVALVAALAGGLIARRVKLPPIVGYLLAGVAIGPGTPGFVGDPETIGELAELGIALLMFGVGLHFSFTDLWRVRRIAIPGAVLQMILSTALGYLLARAWGWTPGASVLLGAAVSIASTVVLVRALVDRGLLDSVPGHVAIGWLVLEDLATVAALVVLPAAAGAGGSGRDLAWALGKAIAFVAVMTLAGTRLVPWALARIARTRSRELFVLAALTVALGIALASARLFGLSIALGAFVAGAVVRGSRYGHQVGADLVPFRDAFSVLFFVSVGMLVDLGYVRDHLLEIAALTLLAVAGKAIIAAAVGGALARSLDVGLVVAAGLAQIGEFSFIVGQAGVSLGILDREQYSLFPAVAVVTIVLNPAVFRLVERLRRALPRRVRGVRPPLAHPLEGHVVVVGHGRVGTHLVEVLGEMAIPLLVIDEDDRRLDALGDRGVSTLLGNAASSEILQHAALDRARAMIVALTDPIASEIVVGRAREIAPTLCVVARAHSPGERDALLRAGASDVVDPQLEGAIELLRRILLLLEVPLEDVHARLDALRAHDHAHAGGARVLDQLVRGTRDLELRWIAIDPRSPVAGRTLGEVALRASTGASCIALMREGAVVANPETAMRLLPGDQLGVIGSPTQIARAIRVLGPEEPAGPRPLAGIRTAG